MNQVLSFTIESKESAVSPVQQTDEARERVLYCDKIKILPHEGGYTLLTDSNAISLENKDIIECDQYRIKCHIYPEEQPTIAFDEPRAPSLTLSEQWQQAGLEPFMSNTSLSHDIINSVDSHRAVNDPLSFLTSQQPHTNATQQDHPIRSSLLANLHTHFEAPLLNHATEIAPFPTHISQASTHHPFSHANHNSAGNTFAETVNNKEGNERNQAPIDQIDELYRESQSNSIGFNNHNSALQPHKKQGIGVTEYLRSLSKNST